MDEHESNRDADLRARIRDLPAPAADPAFREQLRSRFVDGSFPAEVAPFEPRRRSRWLGAGAVLAAAAAVAVVLWLHPWSAPRWRVVEMLPGASVRVDGVERAADETVGREIPPGARIRAEGGELSLGIAGAARIVLAPGTEISVGAERSWRGRTTLTAEVHGGATWSTTGAAFPAGGMRITTPEAEVGISGTTFAVTRWPDTTCVCVLEGAVRVASLAAEGETRTVPPGSRLFVYRRPAPPTMVALPEGQARKLAQVRDLGAPRVF